MAAQVFQAAGSVIPAPVKVENWTPVAYLIAFFAPTTLATIIVAFLKFWPVMKNIGLSADASFRADLMVEQKELRAQIAADRRECDRRLDGMQRKMDAITRAFFDSQLHLLNTARNPRSTDAAHAELNKVLEVIETPIEQFMEPAAAGDVRNA